MSDAQKQKLRDINLGKSGNRPKQFPHTRLERSRCERCSTPIFRKQHGIRRYCPTCKSHVLREGCRDRQGMCRNRNSRAAWYESLVAGRVWLESSWELQCAKILDKHGVLWERPNQGFEWTDEAGIMHRYYPDFYLPLHDIYLDPKNAWERQKGAFKLEQVQKHHPIKLFILNKAEIEEEPLLGLIKQYEPCVGDAPTSESYQDPILLLN